MADDESELRNCFGMRVGFIKSILFRISGPWVGSTIGNVIGCTLFVLLLGFGVIGCVLIEADADTDRFIPVRHPLVTCGPC